MADFTLVDDRLLVPVVVLDRVFHRHDVPFEVLVDVVDHRGQRRRLARPRGPGDDEQATRAAQQVLHQGRQADLLEREQPIGDLAEHEAEGATLTEHAHAEARLVAEREAEVGAPLLLQLLLVLLGSDALHERHGVIGLEHLGGKVAQAAVQAQGRRATDAAVDVARPLSDAGVEDSVDLDRARVAEPAALGHFVAA